MIDIEKCYKHLPKHDKIKIEHWGNKLCEVTTNSIWKANRNNYAKLLLEMVARQ